MNREPLTEEVLVTLTCSDKERLARKAFEQGATMRGYIRKLIRDATNEPVRSTQLHQEGRGARAAS